MSQNSPIFRLVRPCLAFLGIWLIHLPATQGQPPIMRPMKRQVQRCDTCNTTQCTHCNISDSSGHWHWVRSPDQERRVVVAQYNRYCVRCHGVDGKGVWDIPDVPDFTNVRWQQCRSDEQIVRLTVEGRGACMPAFRGTLSLEETWAMARYLRTFAAVPRSDELKPTDADAADKKKEESSAKESE